MKRENQFAQVAAQHLVTGSAEKVGQALGDHYFTGGFQPNYANPNKMAAGLRSTQDRNSAGYMGKRSTF